jgi:hypothetical protein
MIEPKFTRPPDPPPLVPSKGFTAGVLAIEWAGDSYEITGRGHVHTAILRVNTDDGWLPRAAVNEALLKAIVRAPDGSIACVHGVESFCSMQLVDGERIGVLLKPLDG